MILPSLYDMRIAISPNATAPIQQSIFCHQRKTYISCTLTSSLPLYIVLSRYISFSDILIGFSIVCFFCSKVCRSRPPIIDASDTANAVSRCEVLSANSETLSRSISTNIVVSRLIGTMRSLYSIRMLSCCVAVYTLRHGQQPIIRQPIRQLVTIRNALKV